MTTNTDLARDVQALRGGIVVPIPEAEPIVQSWRTRYDPVASLGVPAHITLLYPFLAADELNADGLAFLTDLFGRTPAFQITLAEVGRFPDVVYLAPDPVEWFVALTQALSARFGLLPYGGVYESVVPHLTIAQSVAPAIMDQIATQVAPHLPIAVSIHEVWLMEQRPERLWQHRVTFPLGTSNASPE